MGARSGGGGGGRSGGGAAGGGNSRDRVNSAMEISKQAGLVGNLQVEHKNALSRYNSASTDAERKKLRPALEMYAKDLNSATQKLHSMMQAHKAKFGTNAVSQDNKRRN